MSGGRKNDPHVPSARASPRARLFERHAFFDIGGYIRPSEKPKSSGEQHLRETLCCMLSQSPFSRTKTFFPFFVCVSVHQKASASQKQLPRASFGGGRRTRLHSSPRTETSRRDRAKWCARTRRPFAAFASRHSRNRPGVDRHRVASASRDRVSPRSISPADADRDADRCPPPAPRPQEAIFPEALKSLKEADPDVYALVQKGSSGRCASRLPRARTRRAAARSTRCRRVTRPISRFP